MDFLVELHRKAAEESKELSAKVRSELSYQAPPVSLTIKPSLKIPVIASGAWKSLAEHERDMANLYKLGSDKKANSIYYDKNSHAGTMGNIYKD